MNPSTATNYLRSRQHRRLTPDEALEVAGMNIQVARELHHSTTRTLAFARVASATAMAVLVRIGAKPRRPAVRVRQAAVF